MDRYVNPLTDFGFKKLFGAIPDLKFIYLELPKFKKTEEELETQFDKWLFVLRHLAKLEGRPEQLQEKVFQQLFEVAEIAKFSPEEQGAYEDSLKYYRDIKNVVDTSREEGRLEGREEGLEEGIEKGREEGMNLQRQEIARSMKQAGESLEKIMAYTGLRKEEIERL